MLIYERDPRQRQLPQIYVPQEPRRVMPTELAEEIVLTHPAQPPTASFHEIRTDAITGAAGAEFVESGVVPAENFWWVQGFSGEHDDPVARPMQLEIRQDSPSRHVTVEFFPAVPAGEQRGMTRSLLIPAGWRVRVRILGIAVGQVALLRSMYVEYLEAEMPPRV